MRSRRLSLSAARATLPELLDRVADGEEIEITRHGEPVAVLIRPDALRSRRGTDTIEQAALLRERLAVAAREPRPEVRRRSTRRAVALVAAVRAGRERRAR